MTNELIADLTDREKCEKYAGLVFEIGGIIEDRREIHDAGDDLTKLWSFLWEQGSDIVYERVGPLIDEIEDEVFPKEET